MGAGPQEPLIRSCELLATRTHAHHIDPGAGTIPCGIQKTANNSTSTVMVHNLRENRFCLAHVQTRAGRCVTTGSPLPVALQRMASASVGGVASAMSSLSSDDSEVRVAFFTSSAVLTIPDTPVAVPGRLRRAALSALVNHLLQLGEHPTHPPTCRPTHIHPAKAKRYCSPLPPATCIKRARTYFLSLVAECGLLLANNMCEV
jgi:hypothetical protein